jgi:SAM-dependent methyltransferase
VLLPIARAGIAAYGMDWSVPMLERLRARLAQEPEAVRRLVAITRGDIRCADAGARFPLVIAAGNVPHSFLEREDQRAWLRNARRHLLPGGSLCFDVFQPNYKILTSGPDEIVQVIDRVDPRTGNRVRRYTRCEQEPEFQRFRVVMRWVEEDAAGNVVAENTATCMQRWFTNAELENLLELEGLRVAECWGSFTGEPFAKGASEQIVRAVAID